MSPSGPSPFVRLLTSGRKTNDNQFRMSSDSDDTQKDKTELNADGTLYDDGGDLYDDEVRYVTLL